MMSLKKMYIMLRQKMLKMKYLILLTQLLKTTLNAKIDDFKHEIPSINQLTTKTNLNAKMNEVKGEIPTITNLTTKNALNAVESEIPSVSSLVKKVDYNTKINEIRKKIIDQHYDKYRTTPELNK